MSTRSLLLVLGLALALSLGVTLYKSGSVEVIADDSGVRFGDDTNNTTVAADGTITNTGTATAELGTTTSDTITTTADPDPQVTLRDSDAPGADKDVGRYRCDYIDGADGSENADCWFEIIQAGTEATNVWHFDESDDAWETLKTIHSPAYVSLITDASYTIGTDSSHEAYGGLFVNNDDDALAITLPTGVVGMHMTFANGAGVTGALTVDSVGSDLIVLAGVAGDAGEYVDSTGAAGDQVEVKFIGNNQWLVLESTGTWAAEP